MRPSGVMRGALLMVAATVGFCVVSSLIRQGSHIDSFRVVTARFIGGMALLYILALCRKKPIRFVNRRILLVRGFFGGISLFLFCLAIAKVGLAKGTVISYSYPVPTAIFSWLFLKERLSLTTWLLIVGAVVGIACLAPSEGGGWSLGVYELLALLGAVMAGIAIVSIKKLHDTDSTSAIFMAQCAVGLCIVAVPTALSKGAMSVNDICLLALIAVCASVAQLTYTAGFKHVTASTGAVLNMLLPALNFVVGVSVFREPVSARSIVGTALVVGACVLMVVRSHVADRPASPRP